MYFFSLRRRSSHFNDFHPLKVRRQEKVGEGQSYFLLPPRQFDALSMERFYQRFVFDPVAVAVILGGVGGAKEDN